MDQIPLVRMRYADSFVQELGKLGAPVERLLNNINLSAEMLTARDDFIAVSQLWRLCALSADYTGDRDIGLRAGLTPLAEHSLFGQNLLFAPTLYQAFNMFCEMAPSELTNAEFDLKRAGDRVWFCGGPVYGTPGEILQVGMYRIAMLIQLVRWAVGHDWRPGRIRLQVASLEGIDSDLVQGASLEFNCPEPAVEVPRSLLGLELCVEPPASAFMQGSPENVLFDFRDNFKQILRTHIRGHRFHIGDIARSVDMSVRTLQRRLTDHSLVFSDLVEQTRIDMARDLLAHTDLPIQDIAREVGYIESTHFSRAFSRVTGNSPRDFRHYNSA